ncbi:sensor histidine kinase [Alkalicoccus luteus]|uniref:sensor histidine kinase n=1 Tax=Alkalicoccus luteus TaxID=1237094 RepID=UPI0040347591
MIRPAVKREKVSAFYLSTVTAAGLIVFLSYLPAVDMPFSLPILLLFMLFLFITEYSAIPVFKSSTTLGFPLVFAMDLFFGIGTALLVYGIVVFAVHASYQRPLRVQLFNPAQLIISYAAARAAAEQLLPMEEVFSYALAEQLVFGLVLTLVFYITNNLLVDAALWIRPQPFKAKEWSSKALVESVGFLLSYSYLCLFFILSAETDTTINFTSFFFFFFPLAAISLIGGSNTRLRKEKSRLQSLIRLKEHYYSRLSDEDWMEGSESMIRELFDFDSLQIWVTEAQEWKRKLSAGLELALTEKEAEQLSILIGEERQAVERTDKSSLKEASYVSNVYRTAVFLPIMNNSRRQGLIVVSFIRNRRVPAAELQMMDALKDQIETAVRDRMYREEADRRVLLEERNRIAREIHDGIAQSVAGAVLKLEAANKHFGQAPQTGHKLVEEVLPELRESLKEIRESIFSLRPDPLESRETADVVREEVKKANERFPELDMQFEGETCTFSLTPHEKKAVYHILREALQNAGKHSRARTVHIRLRERRAGLELTIKDDGSGFSLSEALVKSGSGRHFGISQMHEEAERAGGRLELISEKEEGTTIQLLMPAEEEDVDEGNDCGGSSGPA